MPGGAVFSSARTPATWLTLALALLRRSRLWRRRRWGLWQGPWHPRVTLELVVALVQTKPLPRLAEAGDSLMPGY
eukprot:3648489-Pyramimonas_sp.AAC.1